MKRTGLLCFCAALLVALAGCKSTPENNGRAPLSRIAPTPVTVTNQLSPGLLQPPSELFVLGPGDQLDIQVLGKEATRSSVIVGLDGKVYFSLLPGIDVWGLTLEQARVRFEQELSKFVFQSQVVVSLRGVGSKYVWLLGRVNKPGIYSLPGPVTLLEALAMAGGTARAASAVTTLDLADLRHSFVMRQGKVLPVNFVRLLREGDMTQNIYVQPDDFVYIPSSLSQEVYVLGAVASPRTVPYSDPMSLVSAVTGANGPIKNAYLSHVAIVRGSLSQPQLITVDYNDIIRGRTPNIPLEPGDIVFVPLSPYRFLTDYAELIVGTFARTWSANMGVRAVLGSGNSVGVNVPVGAPAISQ